MSWLERKLPSNFVTFQSYELVFYRLFKHVNDTMLDHKNNWRYYDQLKHYILEMTSILKEGVKLDYDDLRGFQAIIYECEPYISDLETYIMPHVDEHKDSCIRNKLKYLLQLNITKFTNFYTQQIKSITHNGRELLCYCRA